MNLSRSAIRHPVTVLMAILVLITIGLMSWWRLPTDMFPELTFPVISVVTRYSGAAPEEVETLVTQPLEEALATINGVTDLTSVSQHGISSVNLEFGWGTNLDTAANDVRDSIQFARRFLPDDCEQPVVVKIDLSKMPIWVGTLQGQRSLAALKRLADQTLKPRLSRIEGVAAVGILSEEEEEIGIEADPRALEGHGLDFARLGLALLDQNRNFVAGDLHIGGRNLTLRTLGETDRIDDIANWPIIAGTDGGVVPLARLARVQRRVRAQDVVLRRKGRPCIAMQIMKQSGRNSVQVVNEVNRELDRIRASLPADLRLDSVFDQAEFINQSIRSVNTNLVVGGILSVVVLFVFLSKLAPVLIIALTIPLSVLITFIPVYFLGYSLNLMSLGGLALGVGMLVDNAIVVLESIDRQHRLGRNARRAAESGARRVAGAITGSTLTTLVVFVPFLFSQGVAARLFVQMGVTISAALLVSLGLAVTLVPMLASLLGERLWGKTGRSAGWTWDPVWYRQALGWCLDRPWTVLAGFALAFVVAIGGLAPRLGAEFLPVADDGMIGSPFHLPAGTSLDESRRTLEPLVEWLTADPRVLSVFERIGLPEGAEEASTFIGLADSNEGEFFIRMVPKDRRTITTRAFLEEVRREVDKIPGLSMNLRQSFDQLLNSSRASIEIFVVGQDLAEVKRVMTEMVTKLRDVPGLRDLDRDLTGGKPELGLRVRRELALRAGLSVAAIGEAVRIAVDGRKIGRFRQGGQEFDLRLQGPPEYRVDPEALLGMPLVAPAALNPGFDRGLIGWPANGGPRSAAAMSAVDDETGAAGGSGVQSWDGGIGIPGGGARDIGGRGSRLTTLREVAQIGASSGEEKLHRRRQMRRGTVFANHAGRPLSEVMAEIGARLETMRLPEGVFVEIGGLWDQVIAAMWQILFVFAFGALLVYMIMASQFESFVDPLCIFFSVPLAAIGMVLGLWVAGQTLNVSSMLGLIILLGIAVNNAIVLIDRVNHRWRHGRPLREALVDGATLRLRPILMTTLTTVLGLIPIAAGYGEGTEVQQPMAIAIMAGLSFSTVLTLVVIPCIHLILNRRQDARRKVPAGGGGSGSRPVVSDRAATTEASGAIG